MELLDEQGNIPAPQSQIIGAHRLMMIDGTWKNYMHVASMRKQTLL